MLRRSCRRVVLYADDARGAADLIVGARRPRCDALRRGSSVQYVGTFLFFSEPLGGIFFWFYLVFFWFFFFPRLVISQDGQSRRKSDTYRKRSLTPAQRDRPEKENAD